MRYILNIVLVIVTVMFGIFGYMQSIEAEKAMTMARESEKRALLAEQDAIRQREAAEASRLLAVRRQAEAEQALRDCDKKNR